MNRRKFFRNGSFFALGTALFSPIGVNASTLDFDQSKKNKKAKNIIVIVSDGMSIGTLNMADIYLNRKTGNGSNWLNLYKENKAVHAMMDMASANSIVTDSAAASSSWGGGVRISNGAINMSANGKKHLPIWQKFKNAGKMAGCVTTVPITHATPAGFCVNSKKRSDQAGIALQYLDLEFDVLMGGGNEYFSADKRKDKRDLYSEFALKGYQVVTSRDQMLATTGNKPVLGVFNDGGLPYTVDRNNDKELEKRVPTLAEMTQTAIDTMKHNEEGFVLQIEAGKVDWAAHGNDISGLLYDQTAHDDAIKVAMDFAEKEEDTLVIITTDHGNSNPGLIYGKKVNENFDKVQHYKHSNEWILNGFSDQSTLAQIKERVNFANTIDMSDNDAQHILGYYKNLTVEEGIYNPRHLPFKVLSDIQGKNNSVGWISQSHSADYVELAMVGPGSHLLKPFIKNTDLHFLMLEAAEVENTIHS